MKILLLFALIEAVVTNGLNLEYLDPTKLQTIVTPQEQRKAAISVIGNYLSSSNFEVEINPILFKHKKDVFTIRTYQNILYIRASSGVAAVWGFNYYLKKYCKSQIAWQNSNVNIPQPLPDVDEAVEASDRFRYYQNVCTASYSFLWWDLDDWSKHIDWMALNGINLALAPVAQEAAWNNIYRNIGLTDEEIEDYFSGPAFLPWMRMGNVHGWGGPLPKSWFSRQKIIQTSIVDKMFQLGMIPVYPAFNGHVPKAFSRLFPNTTFRNVDTWNKFDSEYCCGLYLDPSEPLFKTIGKLFLEEISAGNTLSHIYTADPFNEIKISPWSTELVVNTAKTIFSTMAEIDNDAVWLIQNWMFVHNPSLWPISRVKEFLTSVPNGRLLVLDLQSEQWPQYNLYEMYYGQPFIWCMLHNFGGTLGMFGNMKTINSEVYNARTSVNSTMIGIGLTPEGINQNYVVYDLMLESAWRTSPVDLETWVEDYAERRYGCNSTSRAWKYLLKSVYSFDYLINVRGKYVMIRRPSLNIRPWAWYKSKDLFSAFKHFVFTTDESCFNNGFYHDLVDVTRQALQYRSEQIYLKMVDERLSTTWVFNSSVNRFLDVMSDIESILYTNSDFSASNWFQKARSVSNIPQEAFIYELNARNLITLWGPNGEISDYAGKQWAEMFHYYYIPRWTTFLYAALDAKVRKEVFDEKSVQNIIRSTVESQFSSVDITDTLRGNERSLALELYRKWSYISDLNDLPMAEPKTKKLKIVYPEDTDED